MTPSRPADGEQTLPIVVAMHRLLRTLRRDGGAPAVPPTQLIILAVLREHGPLRIGELAARIPCSQPTATTVVAAMAEEGLLRRDPDPADRRATHVTATEQGLNTLQSVALSEAARLAELLTTLSSTERETFIAAAPVVARLADRPREP